MRRKETDPVKLFRRGRTAVCVILAMCAVLVFINLRQRMNDRPRTGGAALRLEQTIDMLLDSLVAASYPEGTSVTLRGKAEHIDGTSKDLSDTNMGNGYYRTVRVRTPEGDEYTFIQVTDTALTRSTAHWIMRNDGAIRAASSSGRKKIKEIQSKIPEK